MSELENQVIKRLQRLLGRVKAGEIEPQGLGPLNACLGKVPKPPERAKLRLQPRIIADGRHAGRRSGSRSRAAGRA